MKRYLTRERVLTPQERMEAYQRNVRYAQEEADSAIRSLNDAIAAEPPVTETEYVEVKPGEPGYDDAPFENSLVMAGHEISVEMNKRPSPWLSLIEPGKFPGGLGST